MVDIHKLNAQDADFNQQLEQLLAWEGLADEQVNQVVNDIIQQVRQQGDQALLAYTRHFDHWHPQDITDLYLPAERLQAAWQKLAAEQRQALQHAAERIRAYAEKQKIASWRYAEADGTWLGQQVTPLDRVGLYVPGGKAAYPSSVLMNALPAKVAGVDELVMATPTPHGETSELVLAAAYLCGIDKVLLAGGAQAVAALAYGTETLPGVDKIVGPGNIYVAAAKRTVFGKVGIDMLAGPSEIVVICDDQAEPDWVAMDMFAQAEHDENAQAILLCPHRDFLLRVEASIDQLLPSMQRRDIIATALRTRGALIQCRGLDQAVEIANHIAPEHLELCMTEAEQYVDQIQHAGAVFIGHYTPETLSDYCAGPNHVLPTSGTARFSSPLGVYDFQKRTSLLQVSPTSAQTLGKTAATLARGENLDAHARAAEYRLQT